MNAVSSYMMNGQGERRISPVGLAVVALAHVLLLYVLVSLKVVPVPEQIETVMVRMLDASPPPPPAPQPKITPPKPLPQASKPVPQPAVQAPPLLAAQSTAPSPSNAIQDVPKPTPAPVAPAAPSTPQVTAPRFDADYLDNPAPRYPPLSKRMGEEGKVIVRVWVDAEGRAERVELKTSSGFERLDKAALDAVARWKFVPARQGDKPVAAPVLVPISFILHNG